MRRDANICRRVQPATVQMDGDNGKVRDFRPALKADCPAGKRHRG